MKDKEVENIKFRVKLPRTKAVEPELRTLPTAYNKTAVSKRVKLRMHTIIRHLRRKSSIDCVVFADNCS